LIAAIWISIRTENNVSFIGLLRKQTVMMSSSSYHQPFMT